MKIINWLNGKKSVIGGLASLTIGFLQTKSVIDSETAFFALSVSGLILGIGIGHKIKKSMK